MVRRWVLVFAVGAGCGRISFDPTATIDGDANSDGTADASVQRTIPAGAKIWLQMETDPQTATPDIIDSAGHHVTSCANAMCPVRVVGNRGNGYAFTTQEVHVAYAPDLDPSAGFTGAVWVNLSAYPLTSLDCAWSKPFGAAARDTFTLCVDTVGITKFDSEPPVGAANSFDGPVISLHAWHHLAMTWDGSVQRGYLDGVLVGSIAASIGTGMEAFSLGGERDSYHLDGVVDDALYYTRPLADTEIMQLATP